jgi:hypothetical protein
VHITTPPGRLFVDPREVGGQPGVRTWDAE